MAAGAGMQFGSLASAKTLAVAVLAHPPPPDAAGGLRPDPRLFGWTPRKTAVLLAFSALPTASSAYVLAARMGYNGAYVAGLVTLSTVLGLAEPAVRAGRAALTRQVPVRRCCLQAARAQATCSRTRALG